MTSRSIYTVTNIRKGLSQYMSQEKNSIAILTMICTATNVIDRPSSSLLDRELLRQFSTKCVNQWDRTRLDVGAALRVKLTAFEAEFDRI